MGQGFVVHQGLIALQHPPPLPHVKEKQIGLLNSCQREWGYTETKLGRNWIRGRKHTTAKQEHRFTASTEHSYKETATERNVFFFSVCVSHLFKSDLWYKVHDQIKSFLEKWLHLDLKLYGE